jgi:hypothetical protein
MFGVIPMTIVWLIAFLFALGQKSKYEALVQKATEPEEVSALNKLVNKHTVRAVIYGLFFGFFLIMFLVVISSQ